MKSKSLSFLIYSSTFLETLLPSLSSEGICLPCASTLCICVFFRPLWFLTLHPLWLPTVVPSTVSQGGTRSVSDGCWLMKGNENSSWSNDFWTLFVRLQMRIQETMSSTVPWCLSEDLTNWIHTIYGCCHSQGSLLRGCRAEPFPNPRRPARGANEDEANSLLLSLLRSGLRCAPSNSNHFWKFTQSWQHSVLSAESKASLLF